MKSYYALLTLAVVAMASLGFTAGSADAAVISELGVLDMETVNGGINPVTGGAWAEGDTYRLAFVTAGTRDATSANIADYHSFVQSAANAAGYGGTTWYNIGQSYNNPVRNDNALLTGTGEGIFLLDGAKLADDYNDLFNGPDTTFSVTEELTEYLGNVATGSSRKFGDPNQTKIEHGNSDRLSSQWWQVYNGNQSSQWHFYAISDLLTVQAAAVPEPTTFALGALSLLGVVVTIRRRKR